MKTTTTLEEIIRTEAARKGTNDFVQGRHIVQFGDPLAIINQVAHYTPLINEIVNDTFFGDVESTNAELDRKFKQMFTMRFLNREIAYQTVDLFRNKVASEYLGDMTYLEQVFTNFAGMVKNETDGESKTHSTTGGDSTTDSRNATATLPQDQVGLDLNSDNVPYADTTDYGKSKTHSQGGDDSQTDTGHTTLTPDNLLKLDAVYSNVLDRYEKHFLGVW